MPTSIGSQALLPIIHSSISLIILVTRNREADLFAADGGETMENA